MIKRISKIILSLCIFTLPICSICLWLDRWDKWEDNVYKFHYDNTYVSPDSNKTDLQDKVDIGKENPEKSIMIKILEIFWLNTSAFGWDHKFINYVRAILNMALWLLSFIALIMVIYTFYTMFFSKDDKSFGKAKWNLVGIFIALAIIWLARLIVSFIFRWYQSNWKSRERDIETGKVSMITDIDNNSIYLTI